MSSAMARALLGAAAICLNAAVLAEPAPPAPWQEAVVSVSDIERTAKFFIEVAGYERLEQLEESSELLSYWQLPASASARSLVLRKPGTEAAYVRLIDFDGVDQKPIRATARAWDTGGFFSLMVRAKDLPALFDEAFDLGWSAESDPVRFDFVGLSIANVVLKGPDGLNIAVYERLSPPLENWAPFERMTQPFNAMQMVRDKDAAVAFYRDVLGFAVFFDGDYLDKKATMNNFGIPQNYVTKIPRRTGILYPVKGETGRAEVMEFAGFAGRDLSGRAVPPNLGILALRFPVEDLDAWRDHIKQAGWPIDYPIAKFEVAPYGKIRMLGIRTPDGALIELFELL